MDKAIKHECQVLHGDITQNKREQTLSSFKAGSFRVLVATDVAARGLDLSVDLVIQVKPPIKLSGNVDVESYVHRSGRTGRAGKSGICITFYGVKTRYAVEDIERAVGNKFEWLSAPQPADVITGLGVQCAEELSEVSEDVFSYFREAAKNIIADMGAEDVVCAALARISGFVDKPKSRSLLSSIEGMVACQFHSGKEISAYGYVFGALNRVFPADMTANIRGMRFTKDRTGAVFDVPEERIPEVQKAVNDMVGFKWLSVAKELPPLMEDDRRDSSAGFGGRGGRRGGFGAGRRTRRRHGRGDDMEEAQLQKEQATASKKDVQISGMRSSCGIVVVDEDCRQVCGPWRRALVTENDGRTSCKVAEKGKEMLKTCSYAGERRIKDHMVIILIQLDARQPRHG
jgi:ATP-dependent RNA helicase DDX21